MSLISSTTSVFSRTHPSPSKADLALKAEQAAIFVRDFWIALASILGCLLICRLAHRVVTPSIHPFSSPCSRPRPGNGEPSAQSTRQRAWRHLPSAAITAFRIVAFRTTVWIGPETVVSLVEIAFIAGYVTLMLLFVLVDCEF
jgi:ferric-chelate reductase